MAKTINIKKDIQEKNIIEDFTIKKTLLCDVLYINKNKFAINFLGYGIEFKAEHDIDASLVGKTIEIEYESEIGLPSFKAIPKYN